MSSILKSLTILLLVFKACLGLAAERVTYYHVDVVGSPLATTDAGGDIVWEQSYSPYGTPKEDNVTEGQRLGFTGKVQANDSNLVTLNARTYDPELGRFLSKDSVSFYEGGIDHFNGYQYALANPYKFIDPSGDVPILALAIGSYLGDIALSGAINAGTQYFFSGKVEFGGRDGVYGSMGDAASTFLPTGVLKASASAMSRAAASNGVTNVTTKFPEFKIRGLVKGRKLKDLTGNEISNAFSQTGYKLSSHAIMRIKHKRTRDLGFSSLDDIAKIFNKGTKFDSRDGTIGLRYRGLEAIINPRTMVIITIRPSK